MQFELYAIDLESDWSSNQSRAITLAANSSTEIAVAMPCPHRYLDTSNQSPKIPTPSYSVVVAAFLLDGSGNLLSQCVNWPEPLMFIKPRDPHIALGLENDLLTVNVEYPVKGLVLSVEGGEDEIVWSDNCIDVVPNHPYKLTISGLRDRTIQMAYLGHERAADAPLTVK